MNRSNFAHRYTGRVSCRLRRGAIRLHGPSGSGTCRSCGQPSGQCGCGCRECRKESKEFVVQSSVAAGRNTNLNATRCRRHSATAQLYRPARHQSTADGGRSPAAAVAKRRSYGFYWRLMCVHIAVEYAPVIPTAVSIVAILVADTEGTLLAWAKTEQPGGHYHVKENVITTKPGATVTLVAVNATARIRWCEIFSC